MQREQRLLRKAIYWNVTGECDRAGWVGTPVEDRDGSRERATKEPRRATRKRDILTGEEASGRIRRRRARGTSGDHRETTRKREPKRNAGPGDTHLERVTSARPPPRSPHSSFEEGGGRPLSLPRTIHSPSSLVSSSRFAMELGKRQTRLPFFV